eukprot:scaffold1534_cov267-Pinguiococcus_pyrenoidosus.AAC.8
MRSRAGKRDAKRNKKKSCREASNQQLRETRSLASTFDNSQQNNTRLHCTRSHRSLAATFAAFTVPA